MISEADQELALRGIPHFYCLVLARRDDPRAIWAKSRTCKVRGRTANQVNRLIGYF
jgi:hypothetical protein